MRCGKCGTINTGDVKSCFQCGHSLIPSLYDVDKIAGSFKRIFAFLIDMLVVGTLSMVYNTLLLSFELEKGSTLFSFIWYLGTLIIAAVYFSCFEVTKLSATPGKLLFGLVVATNRGNRMSGVMVFMRNLMKALLFILPIMSAFSGWPFFMVLALTELIPVMGDNHQAMHDLVAKSMVLKKD